jgi:hypothetical protein
MFCRLCRIAHDQTDDRHSAAELLSCSARRRSRSFIADNRNERHSRLHNSGSNSSRHFRFTGNLEVIRRDPSWFLRISLEAEYPCEVYGREWELRDESSGAV